LGATAWQDRLDKVQTLENCMSEDAGCVDAWLRGNASGEVVYVLVPSDGDSGALMRSVAASQRFDVVWAQQDLVVARWSEP